MRESRIESGLTLVELLIVVFVLTAIAAVAVPRISRSAELAQDNACQRNIGAINAAIEVYAKDNGGVYPADEKDFKSKILDNLCYLPEGTPRCPIGGQYQYDPVSRRVICSHPSNH